MTDPTPDPELSELASAYLDGAAPDGTDERVGHDPELAAEVERLRLVRALVSTSNEPAAVSTREAQLAAALDVFDRMTPAERAGEVTPASGVDAAAAAAISTPTPTGSRRPGPGGPRPIGQWLLGAAAALLLVVGGVAIVRGVSSGSDDEQSATEAIEGPDASVGEADDAESRLAEDAADSFIGHDDDEPGLRDDVSSDDVAANDDRSAPAAPPADTDAMEQEAAGDTEAAADEGGTAEDADAESPPSDIELDQLENARDLADFGALAAYADTSAQPATTLPASTPSPDDSTPGESTSDDPSSCADELDFDVVAGPALYRGEPVLVGVLLFDSGSGGTVLAVDENCVETARAALPDEDDVRSRRDE